MNAQTFIDPNTGEAIDIVRYVTVQQQENIEKKIQQTKVYRQFTNNFTWILFNNGEDLFPDISDINLLRLMYLVSFCRYDNTIMLKSKACKKLGVKKTTWNNFWSSMTQHGILADEHDLIRIADPHFLKGKLDSKSKLSHTRMFCNYIKELYESNKDSTKLKQVSCLFKVIPYIHPTTNIICYNPEVDNIDDIQCMKIGDFCDIVGYNKKNGRRLLDDLLQIKVKGSPTILLTPDSINRDKKHFVINPNLLYGGKNDEIYQSQMILFGLSDQNNCKSFVYSCGSKIEDVFKYFGLDLESRMKIMGALTPMGYSELNMCYAAAIDKDRLTVLAGTDQFVTAFINSVKINVNIS